MHRQTTEYSAGPAGWVGNVQQYSLHDGPGIRTTVFLRGCPLRCAWCHNPENLPRQPEILVVEARCARCGQCVDQCPASGRPAAQATPAEPRPPRAPGPWLPEADCQRCGACVEACPTGARQWTGRLTTVGPLLAEVLRDRVFFEDSQGGVTFSGGEPLAQFEFLAAMLAACRERGLHTAVDTCGFAPLEHLLAIAPLTSLFLYDLKFLDDRLHQRYCGVSNGSILANLTALGAVHDHIWLRVPVIPGLNDAPEEIAAIAQFARTVRGLRQVNLLPYHQSGIHKFARLGRAYPLAGLQPPSSAQLAAVAAQFAAVGLPVTVGG